MTTKDGKQVPLGVKDASDEAAAWAAFQAIFRQVKGDGATPDVRTVRQAVAGFLLDREDRVKPDTLRGYTRQLQPLLAQFGTERITSLDLDAVAKDAKGRGWSDTTRANYLNAVELVLKWAGRPYQFDKPPKASAGAESVIPPEVYEKVLLVTTGDFRQLVRLLWLTGCRPSEAAAVTAAMVDWSAGVVRFKDHKTRRHGKARQLYLCPEGMAVLRAQREKYQGDGLLFRGKCGRPFSRQAFVMRFDRISKRIGRRVTAYNFRHTFATRALQQGVPDTQVAALMGHANTNMIHRHYSHVSANARLLRDVAAKLNQPPAA